MDDALSRIYCDHRAIRGDCRDDRFSYRGAGLDRVELRPDDDQGVEIGGEPCVLEFGGEVLKRERVRPSDGAVGAESSSDGFGCEVGFFDGASFDSQYSGTYRPAPKTERGPEWALVNSPAGESSESSKHSHSRLMQSRSASSSTVSVVTGVRHPNTCWSPLV